MMTYSTMFPHSCTNITSNGNKSSIHYKTPSRMDKQYPKTSGRRVFSLQGDMSTAPIVSEDIQDADLSDVPIDKNIASPPPITSIQFSASPYNSPVQKRNHRKAVAGSQSNRVSLVSSCSSDGNTPYGNDSIASRPSELLLNVMNLKNVSCTTFGNSDSFLKSPDEACEDDTIDSTETHTETKRGTDDVEKESSVGHKIPNAQKAGTNGSNSTSNTSSTRPLSSESTDSFPGQVLDTSMSSMTSNSSSDASLQIPPSREDRRFSLSGTSTGSAESSASITDSARSRSNKVASFSPLIAQTESRISMLAPPSYPAGGRMSSVQSLPTISQTSQETLRMSSAYKVLAASAARKKKQRKSLSKAEKEKLWDQDTGNDVSAATAMYNVPMASSSTVKLLKSTSSRQSKKILREAWAEAENGMVLKPSPLPGNVSVSASASPSVPSSNRFSTQSMCTLPNGSDSCVNRQHRSSVRSDYGDIQSPELCKESSFTTLSPTAQQLSNFYEYSLKVSAHEEMDRRSKFVDEKMCGQQKELADQKLVDLRLMSPEKLKLLSSTRPIWLPPKDKQESSRQEREFRRLIKHQGRKLKRDNFLKDKRTRERMIGDARLLYLSKKDELSSRNVAEIRKLFWNTSIKSTTRMTIFGLVLRHELGINSNEELNNIPAADSRNAPVSAEVDSIVDSMLHTCDDPKLITVLTNLLKRVSMMKSWTLKSSKSITSLLNEGFTSTEIIRTLHYLNDLVITEQFVTKFNDNILRNRVMVSAGKHFKDDLNVINMKSLTQIISTLSITIIFKLFNLLLVTGDYKLLYALVLTILLHYHFGWNNVQLLLNCNFKENPIKIEDEELFWDRVYHFYSDF